MVIVSADNNVKSVERHKKYYGFIYWAAINVLFTDGLAASV